MPLVTAGPRPIFIPRQDELRAVLADNFDPREIVCLPQHLRAAVQATNQSRATITDLQCAPQRLAFKVAAEEPAMVVLAQSYYHAWKARVDGRGAPLWRANHAFQALQVPAGEHQIVLIYQDRRLFAGAIISTIAVVVCLLLWRRRSVPKEPIPAV